MDPAAGKRDVARPDHDRAEAADPLEERLTHVDVLDAVELDVVDLEREDAVRHPESLGGELVGGVSYERLLPGRPDR